MNLFYEVYINSDIEKGKNIELYFGDTKLDTKLERFELLFVIDDENQISKMECNFLLHPDRGLVASMYSKLFYINLPVDLLHKNQFYVNELSLINSNDISDVDEFRKRTIKEKGDVGNYYETIDLPPIVKFRCRNYKSMSDCLWSNNKWLFQFSTSIPEILQSIEYNTLKSLINMNNE